MPKPQKISQEQLDQEKAQRLRRQEVHDIAMITALAAGRLVCHDPVRGTWSAEEYFVPGRQVWVTKAEVQDGLVFDGWLGVSRPLTPVEKLAHLLGGRLPIMRPPGDYVQPPAFASGPPTEVI